MRSKNTKRILFIENRGKTRFWERIAIELVSYGFDVHFLVQSPMFRPRNLKNIHFIEIPNKKTLESTKVQVPFKLKSYLESRDRGFRYFNSGSDHYGYYHSKIKEVLETISPDLVVGECTLFHELITIFLCKELSLKFVHPVISITIVWILAIPLTLFLHQKYVFKATNDKKKMLFKYYINYLLTYLLNLIILYLAVDVLFIDPIYSQFYVVILLSIINFLIIRKFYIK